METSRQAALSSRAHRRWFTPAESARRPLPRRTLMVLGAAVLVSIPTSPESIALSELLWSVSMLVSLFAACSLANWLEQRVYTRLLAVGSLPRVIISSLLPLAGLFGGTLAIVLLAVIGSVLGDNGVMAVSALLAMLWFTSSAFGSLIIVMLDVAISAIVSDFRSRIQLAIFSLLSMSTLFILGIYVAGRALGGAIASMDPSKLEGKVTIQGTTITADELQFWLHAEGTSDIIALGTVLFAVAIGLPAILSACGKLADAVMERLHPLREAFEEVSRGKLDVRVEEGGSRELRLITSGFNRMTESLDATLGDLDAKNRDLALTNEATSRFVPFQFLELLRKSSIREIERGDQVELDISVLFSDIRSFTTMAEAIGPRDTFAFINRYLAEMEPEIHRERGFINNVFGDGIMALFHTGADAALRAALGMLTAVERFNATLETEGKKRIVIGIGMDSGSLMLGTIGGRDRLNCTVIGDPANSAARVEGMTKLYGASLLLAERTHQRLTANYLIREIDRVQALGKNESFALYEVLDGEPSARRNQKWDTRDAFSAALADYRRGDFAKAQRAFTELRERAPDDRVLAVYLERCLRHLEHPPSDWDGITRLETK